MKTAIIIDHTGIGNSYINSFGNEYAQWIVVESLDMISDETPSLVIFMQIPKAIPAHWVMPILINDTTASFALHAADDRPIARFCGWPTMIERPVWEMAPYNSASTTWTHEVEKLLNRRLCIVPNQPGFIAARVLATVFNEACFGLANNICTANDMDVAMRLGTNYPKGPIAWMHEIGKKNIVALLSTLALQDKRYTPHPFLNLD